jgi:transposase
MKKIVKQVVGIDVAQKELVVCLGKMYDDWTPDLCACKTFANTPKGFKALVDWTQKLTDKTIAVRFVMEATGVYHESLAYYLDENAFEVSIVLPNKISNYARSLDIKTVTDKTASEAIAQFGLERKLDQWHRPKKLYKTVKQLTRERNQLIDERVVLKNQLHAEKAEAQPYKKSIDRITKRITLINKQELEIKSEIAALVKSDSEFTQDIALLSSIPGIGMLTAAIILSETNRFELIRNKRQLTSYVGLDVKEKQSGTSVKGKPRISKKGNKQIRRALHFPALSAIRHEERYKAIFARLVSKHGIKMKAAVAVQRKLLEMTFIVYKTKTPYNTEFVNEMNSIKTEEECEVV